MAKQKEEIYRITAQHAPRRLPWDISEIKQRLELALRVKKPTPGEVLEEVSTRGVLRGPVDWVFPAWMLYVEYAAQKIAETFQLSEEERSQLLDFRNAMKRLLRETWMQTKEKLAALYKTVAEGTYKADGKRLYAPDGMWICKRELGSSYRDPRRKRLGVFPRLAEASAQKLELLQLGWRASDEGNDRGRPVINTTQPWQIFAWTAARY